MCWNIVESNFPTLRSVIRLNYGTCSFVFSFVLFVFKSLLSMNSIGCLCMGSLKMEESDVRVVCSVYLLCPP